MFLKRCVMLSAVTAVWSARDVKEDIWDNFVEALYHALVSISAVVLLPLAICCNARDAWRLRLNVNEDTTWFKKGTRDG